MQLNRCYNALFLLTGDKKMIEKSNFEQNLNFFEPSMSIGIGIISYSCGISEADNKFYFTLIAKPQRSDRSDEIQPIQFDVECDISETCAAKISQTIESVIEQFPDSENYFNKMTSFKNNKWKNSQFVSVSNATGIYMTNDFIRETFKLVEESVGHTIAKNSRSNCTIS